MREQQPMELRKIGRKTYYITNHTNIGVYQTGEKRVCLIDTGSKGDGEKIDEIISAQGWEIDYIINTHTHIDHLGGNEYLMRKYNIPAYCTAYDMAFAHYSDLESAYMNGGHPCRQLRRIFSHPGMIGFDAIESKSMEGLEWKYLPGHTFSMIGVKTDDQVWFLGDAYLSGDALKRHRFGYLYDVGGYLNTLDKLSTLEGNLFVPSHGDADTDIGQTVELNKKNIQEILELLKEICCDFISLDQILKRMYEEMGMRATLSQHALLSSTTKCYLTYLQDLDQLECKFIENVMMWKSKE